LNQVLIGISPQYHFPAVGSRTDTMDLYGGPQDAVVAATNSFEIIG